MEVASAAVAEWAAAATAQRQALALGLPLYAPFD